MNPVRRWLKFNVVGVAGMLVQLVTLAGLNHIVPRHYLVNALVAVETAILHNFIAHVHYTWRDRILRSAWRDRILHHPLRDSSRIVVLLRPLWRFQVSNGAVSLAGNAVLMKLLVGGAHLPVLVANCIAIFVCGLVNFWLGDNWAFAQRGAASRMRWLRGFCFRGVALVLVVLQASIAVGQETAQAQTPQQTKSATPVPVLSAAAQKIKDEVSRVADDGKMTVRMLDGVVYHGRLDQAEAERFTIHEVDLAQTVPIKYADVKSVKGNYGNRGFGGGRPDPVRGAVIGAIAVAGLLGLLILALASDKS